MSRTPRRMRLLTLVAVLGVAQTAPACARNPVTGQLQLALISEAQEIELGRQSAEQAVRSMGLVPDEALQSYVQEMGTRLALASERPHLPWTFRIVDDPTPNAFAAPGGFIFFTRGMLALMDSEAELAAVVGHEIGHVTARHTVNMISRAQVTQLGLGLGGALFPQLEALGGLAGAGAELLFLRYGRDAERQADDLGFRYALEQGYDPARMANVFRALERVGEAEQRSAVPSWLQTHPLPGERIVAVEAMVAAAGLQPGDRRVAREEYLQRINGLVYGVNPRNGFFRDGRFLHPDLRFQLAFPAGWQTQNMAQAVMAASPRNDAALQLTIAQDATPDAAAQRFFAQQGVVAGQARRQSVNGLPALVVPFQVQTQQGVLQGLSAWIQHEGRVYHYMGFTPAQAYASNERVILGALGSFAPLTDAALLAVQPSRLQLVRLPEAMTLGRFAERYPSAIGLAELARINRVDDPATVLPAGLMVKRVAPGN